MAKPIVTDEDGQGFRIMLCTEEDVFPWGNVDPEDDEYIEEANRRHAEMMAQPRCSICGEGPQFFKNGKCPYINAPDHRQGGHDASVQESV